MAFMRPNGFSGASAMTSPIAAQLGLVTMAPLPSALAALAGSSPRWPGLISGISSGTSAAIR